VSTLVYLTNRLETQGVTIKELRKLLFGLKSEKLSKVLDDLEAETTNPAGATSAEAKTEGPEVAGGASPTDQKNPSPSEEKEGQDEGEAEEKRRGHGRNPADAYKGAEKIYMPHETLKPGDPCPETGCRGKVYELMHPSVLVRVVGRSFLGAKVIERQQLRCNLCGKVFTAQLPDGVGPEKYDETAASMIAILRYGTGLPFNRLEGLQENFGIPLPASTQWDIVERLAKLVGPAYNHLIREAAQGDVLHNDDTPVKILKLMEENKKRKERKGDDG
jgi:transposase